MKVLKTLEYRAKNEDLTLNLLCISGRQGVLLTEIKKYAHGVKADVSYLIEHNEIEWWRLTKCQRTELRLSRLINGGRPPKFIPKESVKDIAKKIGSKKVAEIYELLWNEPALD